MRSPSASSGKVVDFKDLAKLSDKQYSVIEELTRNRTASILIGGSGYGGKSVTLRAAAVFSCMAYCYTGFRSPKMLLVRNTYKDLKDNHAGAFRKEWGQWGEVVTDKVDGYCFRFFNPALGVILLRNVDELNPARGSRVGCAFVDEVTEIPKKAFGDLTYQASAPGPFNAVVGGCNPDGVHYLWVMENWRCIEQPGDWWVEDGQNKRYIQFYPEDNPIWEETKEVFLASIAHLPEFVRIGRLKGTWGSPEGARWPHVKKEIHQFRMEDLPEGIPPHWRKGLGIDYGLAAPFAAYSIAIDPEVNRIYVYRERYGEKVLTEKQAESIRDSLEVGEKMDWCLAEPAMWQKSPDPTNRVPVTPAGEYEKVFYGEPRLACGLAKGRQITDRTMVWALWDVLTRVREDGTSILQIEEGCKKLWQELTTAVYYDKKEQERRVGDINPKNADHGLTAVWYGLPTWAVDKILNPKPKVSEEEKERRRLQKMMMDKLRGAA